MADTASYEMNYDRLSVLVRVEIDALFEYDPSDSDRTADSPPDLALARFVAADFEQAASAKLGYTVTVEESWPKVVLWEAGTSSSPYIVNPSGFQIDSLGFDAGCATRGCWVMDVTISGGAPGSVNVLFLPRAEGETEGVQNPEYSQDVLSTFASNAFPCNSLSSNSAQSSACCLVPFVLNYRAPAAFSTWVEQNLPAECAGPDVPDSMVIIEATSGLLGAFEGIPESSIALLASNDVSKRYRVSVPEEALRALAGQFSGTVGVQYRVDSFIGFANLVPLGSPVLDSSVTQVSFTVEKADVLTVATHGNAAQSKVSDVSLGIHSVRDMFDADDAQKVYFAALSFSIPSGYSQVTVPQSSVRVGRGNPASEVTWWQACPSTLTAAEQANSDLKMAQSCAPEVAMCADPVIAAASTGAVYIPVDEAAVTLGAEEVSGETSLFVEFVVRAIDEGGQLETTLISASLPLSSDIFLAWCDNLAAHVLEDFASATALLAGADDMATLQVISTESAILNAYTSTVEDQLPASAGFLSLVIQGDPAFFEQPDHPQTADMCLVLEDLVTVHLMENAETLYDEVRALISANTALDVAINREEGTASMLPSAALLALCPQNPPEPSADELIPAACITRVDVRQRQQNQDPSGLVTALELPGVGEDATAAQTVIEGIVGTGMGVAAYLAEMRTDYGLNGRYNLGYWINPGYAWGQTTSSGEREYILSKNVLVLSLMNLDQACVARRRAALAPASSSSSSASSSSGPSGSPSSFASSPAKAAATTARAAAAAATATTATATTCTR